MDTATTKGTAPQAIDNASEGAKQAGADGMTRSELLTESTPERVRALITIAKQEGVKELVVGDIRVKLATSPEEVTKLMGALKDLLDKSKNGRRRTRR